MAVSRRSRAVVGLVCGAGLAAGCDPVFSDAASSVPASTADAPTATSAGPPTTMFASTPSTQAASTFERTLLEFEPTDAQVLWAQTESPLGDPVLDGDTVLIYNSGPTLTALDIATGEQRWTAQASLSDAFFATPSPLVIDGTVIAYFPIGEGSEAEVVGLDVATGERRWVSETGVFEDVPFACGEGAACVVASGMVRQFVPATGEQIATWATGETHLVGDIYSTDVDGALVVSRDEPAGRGWSFGWQEAAGVAPDTRFAPVAWQLGTGEVTVMAVQTISDIFADPTHDSMLAVDTATGSMMWSAPDATVNCAGRGEALTGFKTLRCRIAGDLIGVDRSQVDGEVVTYTPSGWTELTDTFEAFDPATGNVLGSVVATPIPAWDGEGERPTYLRYGRIADAAMIQTPTGAVAVNPATGETAAVPAGRIAWCASLTPGDVPGFRACDPSTVDWAEPEGRLPPMVPAVGVSTGDLVAFIRDGSLTAYRVGAG